MENDEVNEMKYPFEYCNQLGFFHLQAVFQQKSNAADPVGYLDNQKC